MQSNVHDAIRHAGIFNGIAEYKLKLPSYNENLKTFLLSPQPSSSELSQQSFSPSQSHEGWIHRVVVLQLMRPPDPLPPVMGGDGEPGSR